MNTSKGLYLFVLLIFVLLSPISSTQAQTLGSELMASGELEQSNLLSLKLVVDGVEAPIENRPFLLASGRSVIAIQALQRLIPCQIQWGQAGELIILCEQKRIQIYPDQDLISLDSMPINLETGSFISNDGVLFLPLRALTEALGYTISYDASSCTIVLNSPGYQLQLIASDVSNPEPITIDFMALPTWGGIFEIPGLANLWPEEKIVNGYFTRLLNSPLDRTNNIIIASSNINGKILQTGEIFSFNSTVGPRTRQTGFKNAKVFVGQQVVDGIGGGICQASSTIYNAALVAGMQVLERHPHSLKVAYVPPGKDATVSWGQADLKLLNKFDYPVKILCKVDNGFVFALIVQVEPPATAVTIPQQ